MFESKKKGLLPRRDFYKRILRSFILGLILIAISLYLGMMGYHHYEGLSWIDAYANASMILSGMGPLSPLQTEKGKLFAGTYALFSGLIFIIILGVILAPVIHRFLHKFHLQEEKSENK